MIFNRIEFTLHYCRLLVGGRRPCCHLRAHSNHSLHFITANKWHNHFSVDFFVAAHSHSTGGVSECHVIEFNALLFNRKQILLDSMEHGTH